jgi:uncharacterized protein (TIGR04255 family)
MARAASSGRRRGPEQKPRASTKPRERKPSSDALSAAARAGHLKHAPIVEAMIDLRVDRADGLTLDGLLSVHARIERDYPVQKTRRIASSRLDLSDAAQPVATADSRIDAYRFETRDGQRVLQAQMDGFTFSQLKPYEDWTTFRDEAKRLWRTYVAIAKPDRVKRVGLRFINRIELPTPTGKLDDWLLTRPNLADGMPLISDLFMRVVFPLQALNAFAVITEAVDRSDEPTGTFPIILDIDVFREGVFSPTDEEIWAVLDQFRTKKNSLFFKSITQRTRKLFA